MMLSGCLCRPRKRVPGFKVSTELSACIFRTVTLSKVMVARSAPRSASDLVAAIVPLCSDLAGEG